MSTHPLKQLALTVDNLTNCGRDVSLMIVMYDTDFKQLKSDLAKAMQDRVDRKLEYKKISYKDQKEIHDGDILDYEITTIIHGRSYEITFATLIGHRFGIKLLPKKSTADKGESLITEITYNGGDFSADQISDDVYPRKCLRKLTKEEFDNFKQ